MVTLTDLTSLSNETSAVNTINNNNATVENEFEDVFYRDGRSAITGDIDVNGNRLLNLPAPEAPSDPVRLSDIEALDTTGAAALTLRLELEGSSGSSLVGHGETTVEEYLDGFNSIKAEGAIGNGVADDTAVITAVDALPGKKFVPRGTYMTTLASTDLDGPYWGEGQIDDMTGNKRAPWFSAIKAAPSSLGAHDSVETAFNGDLSKNQIAMEHRITGTDTLGKPTTGYLYRPEAMPFYGYMYNASGHNQGTADNTGRTGVAFHRTVVFQAGQGDAVCYNASAFVTGTRAGSTSFLANPAAVLFNGDIEAGQNGTYLNAGELALNDGGFDVAGIGWVVNLLRSNATGAKNAFWAGFRAQSQGTQPPDQAFGAAGAWKVGLDFTPATFGTNNVAISMMAGQRISFNNASSNGLYTTSFNGDFIEYSNSASALNFVRGGTSRMQVASDRITMLQPPVLPTVTSAGLPSASTRTGMEYYVRDANATTRFSVLVGGGSNFVKVFSNGTNWIIA